MSSDKRFYVYCHKRLDNGEIFYIGKGTKDRYKVSHKRTKHWNSVANKYGYTAEILIGDLTNEEALTYEHFMIVSLGRSDLKQGNLVNHINGGDSGCCGFKPVFTIEHRMKISLAKKQLPAPIKNTESKYKKVGAFINGNLFQCFDSIKEASQKTGIGKNRIVECSNGRLNFSGFYSYKSNEYFKTKTNISKIQTPYYAIQWRKL